MYILYCNSTFFINHAAGLSLSYIVRYPSPRNLGYFWNYGSLTALFLCVQICTGLILSMFYTANIELAFDSIDNFMNNIPYGWVVRYAHLNGASFMFLCAYLHLFRGIYYGSYQYPRIQLWVSGITIFLVLMATAFLGYVLPWGQMSFWAATVITNFVTIVPHIGDDLLCWIWGGYSINNATLSRFFSLHYILPFILAVLSALHLYLLHEVSSSTELKVKSTTLNKISFFPYYIAKDLITVWIFVTFFLFVISFLPEVFNHSINYIPANYLVTPKHIVPEWYFLPYYAILRSIPNKLIGILMMGLSILILYGLPFFDSKRYLVFSYSLDSKFFFVFILNIIYLGFLGSQTMLDPSCQLGLICTISHFIYLVIYVPLNRYHLD